ncbi:arsenic resistance protein [Humidisolicoccus flavus]|uniref:arsenic resistance protein n=1 Tax=Humidisolicoccus flavus TaxID=3111414 RepID=UPI003249BE05
MTSSPRNIADWLSTHQIAICGLGIVTGALVGWLVPGANVLEWAITPALMILLFATFLGVPILQPLRLREHARFFASVLLTNFVAVPALAWLVSRLVAGDDALVFGVLLVLLTPCVDYVIVFTRMAGGDAATLLRSTPLLMLLQFVLLPVFLFLFLGSDAAAAIAPGPFVQAFLLIIAMPFAAAALVQRFSSGAPSLVIRTAELAMVPVTAMTLFLVLASQFGSILAEAAGLSVAVGVYVAFVLLAFAIGVLIAKLSGLAVPESRALVFSGVTRNSLVVLPLAFALPEGYAIVPVVVVTQTVVELLAMLILVRVVPRVLV